MPTRFFISVKLKERATKCTICVTSMYGPDDRTLKPFFLQDLHTIHAWCLSESWVLMGDFNMTRFLDERQDCKGNINNMDSFNDLIRALGLIDIPLGGRSLLGLIKESH